MLARVVKRVQSGLPGPKMGQYVKATQSVRLVHTAQHAPNEPATYWSLVGATGQLP